MSPTAFDTPLYVATIGVGVVLIAIARWASRRGGRWDTLVALRIGSVLFTEIVGAFLIGYGIGALLAVQLGPTAAGPGRPPPIGVGRFRGAGRFGPFDPDNLPVLFGLLAVLVATLMRVDVRDLFTPARTRDPLAGYVGAESRTVAAIPAGGYGKIVLPDADGNLRPVAATADTDIPAGAVVVVVGTRDLNLVVAPK